MAISLTSCKVVGGLFGNNNASIQQDHAEQLFEIAGEFLTDTDDQQAVFLYCVVSEFSGCYLVDVGRLLAWDGSSFDPEIENLDNAVDRDLGRQITSNIGAERIVNANRSGVKVRCERPTNAPDQISCWIDHARGNGWEVLRVV